MRLLVIGAILLATGQFVAAAHTSLSATTADITLNTTNSNANHNNAATATTSSTATSTNEDTDLAPQVSPSFPNLYIATGVITTYNGTNPYDAGVKSLSRKTLDLSKYPEPWAKPDVNHEEVQAAIKAINWDLVPKSNVRPVTSAGDIDFTGYDENTDTDCWWSASNCLKPKVDYLPEDIYTCPRKGEWGLTYDDGPFNMRDHDDKDAANENPYAEPQLYNFLADRNIKSNLFYIGSSVVTYPAAARRALNDGHYICSHTWSHPPMTTQSNEEAVAEFYWTLHAIKEATGITPKCWRPPQGDVDDRIRAIAWQMGMRTVIWDKDTQDWAMPAPGGGTLAPSKVNAKFSEWLKAEKAGTECTGTIVLEHELSSATVRMSEKWLPKVQKVYKVVPALACNDVTQPYWETNFQYPSIH